ncbi:hypothetical protein PIB30_024398 [Stylosanthes scabra]|uniref:Uncharacterized protein n=1 Tax=Stylosanthes scabra TaxID=79078 RepID=A0ABU6T9H4_9FABA|nr:hypothetical protein [Stylosanthes scabra]
MHIRFIKDDLEGLKIVRYCRDWTGVITQSKGSDDIKDMPLHKQIMEAFLNLKLGCQGKENDKLDLDMLFENKEILGSQDSINYKRSLEEISSALTSGLLPLRVCIEVLSLSL